ncbi:MAG: metallophosphoesterase family protein [Chloroflexota bacterium]|nr:metallophosphoesterase family protein [Chloroflexota bacterium]
MRLAVLADIHGNGEALRAVMADLDGRGGADRLLVLGDIVLLGPDPGEVVELLLERDALGVYGNTDCFLLATDWFAFEPRNEEAFADQALCLWALEQLDERAGAWLRALPFQRELEVGDQKVLDRTVGSVRLINPGSVGYPQGEQRTARYALLTW